MSDWLYHGEPFLDPGEHYGFVYMITNNTTGRKYIGKKFFWFKKRKQVNKKRKTVTVESDWKSYWSSSEEVKKDVKELGKGLFTREIIHLCPTKGVTNYLEAKEQFLRNVLEQKDEYYNGIINCRVSRSHINKLNS